ncbi:MAG: MFS transporter [Gemmatimonadota bacterium]
MAPTDSRRALTTLTVAQGLGLCAGPVVVMLGGLVGGELAPSPDLATFPVAAAVVGIALAAAPAALLMERVGRRRGFALGAAIAGTGALLAAAAVGIGSFLLFSLGSLLIGANLAFVMQYRFAAAETAAGGRDARAVGTVLAGGILAGLLGPEIVRWGRDLAATPWVGSLLLLASVQALLAAVVLVGLDRDGRPAGAPTARPTASEAFRLARRPGFFLAASAGVVAYTVMGLVMTATPVAMHGAGFDVDATALVIEIHVVSMYGPSLAAGFLVARVGLERLMATGLFAMGACAVLSLVGDGLGAWVGGLALLGLGWNVLFLGGTVTLSRAFPGADRFPAQALNEGLVFGARAVASLCAGFLLAWVGWPGIHVVSLGALAAMAAVLVAGRLRWGGAVATGGPGPALSPGTRAS